LLELGYDTTAHEEVEGLVHRITLLEGKLAEARQAREMADDNSQSLSDGPCS
jgi:hypothetical protein